MLFMPHSVRKKNSYRHHAGQKQYTGEYKDSTSSCLTTGYSFHRKKLCLFQKATMGLIIEINSE